MTQYVINIGALPNDGTGDPLRTAFNDVNLNFNQVWATGLIGSNLAIANNTILTTNTNGNLILNPNGIGLVQANAHVIPDQNRIRNLGSSTRYWDTGYIYYGEFPNANIGNAKIGNTSTINIAVANLHVSGGSNGYVLQTDGTGNLTWTAQTGGGGNGVPGGANTQIQFNDANEFGGAAGFTFNKLSNAVSVPGNVSAVGNVLTAGYVSAAGNVRGANINTAGGVSAAGNIVGANILGNIQAADGNTSVMFNKDGFLGADGGFSYDYVDNTLYVETVNISGKNTHGDNALYVGVTGFTPLGSNVVAQLAGNADSYTQVNFQNINPSPTASGDYIITANNGTDSEHFIDMGIAGNTWDGTQTNSLGTRVGPNDGYLYVNGANLVVGTAITGGDITTWKFNTDGTLELPSGNITGLGNIVGPGNISYPFGPGAVLLANVDGGNNSSYFSLTSVANATGVIGYMGPAAFSNNAATGLVYTTDGNGNSYDWYFQADGTTSFPSYTFPNVDGANTQVLSTDGDGTLYWANAGGGNTFSAITMSSTPTGPSNQINYGLGNLVVWNDGGWTIGEYNGTDYGTEGIRINPGIEGPADIVLPADAANVPVSVNNYVGGVVVNAGNGSIQLSATANSWIFNPDASVQFPQIYTPRGDNPSGNIYGYTLVIGDGDQEAVITTPNGIPGNEYSQRLVINPGAGNNYGEGGDIYLWAGRGGDGSGSGGDIKIRGGQGGANTSGGNGGDGGYIRMEAGDSASTGGSAGFIEITGGYGAAGSGGYVRILGGQGSFSGGDANLTGGYGPAIGGSVNITGGVSGNSLGEYGNIYIHSGASTWTFDNTGNLTPPVLNNAQQTIRGTTQTILGDPFPASISNSTANVTIWTADSAVVSGAKMTLKVVYYDTNLPGWNNTEIMDIMMVKNWPDGTPAFTVTNRIKTNNAYTNVPIDVTLNGSNAMQVISSAPDGTGNNVYWTYSVTSFNQTFD